MPTTAAQPSLLDVLGATEDERILGEAESALLQLADFVYTKTSLKPMSKTLFFVSRCLLAAEEDGALDSAERLTASYERARASMGAAAPSDDFSFAAVVGECNGQLAPILQYLGRVKRLTTATDVLGLAFNTLLRGKWEGGEGLGTYLTPEEVVRPMVRMALHALPADLRVQIGHGDWPLYGDICGGTGRFVFEAARQLHSSGTSWEGLARAARLFDQSAMSVDLARINFALEHGLPSFERVEDSLTDEGVSRLMGRFALLATNPPFGSGKYEYSASLGASIHREVLAAAGIQGPGDVADPGFLFVFRNLDLLCPGGVLAIVLPDGIVHSASFRRALAAYEAATGAGVQMLAMVSLPSAAFALGGTVAKTSFLMLQRSAPAGDRPLFLALAKHIGFKKRGNRRVPDPGGNELVAIAEVFERSAESSDGGRWVTGWRDRPSFAPADLARVAAVHRESDRDSLSSLARPVRRYVDHPAGRGFHVSILDVDETGLIEIRAAAMNRPVTRSLECRPGDLLVSCLNPKIWRVCVVPDVEGVWTCSPEFAVFRPEATAVGWQLALLCLHKDVRDQVQSMVSGTSSSRQRVPKELVGSVLLPAVDVAEADMQQLREHRNAFYQSRIREVAALARLASGEHVFRLA